MHLNSRLMFEKHARRLFKSGMKVLEIGPDGFPSTYKQLVAKDDITWETLDIYASEKLTYTAKSEYEFPIADESFDIVVSGQVIEHVRKIWVWIKEVARVCRTGGYVITINPVNWEFHEAPIDCWRMYPEGMKALYDEAGLQMEIATFEALEPRLYSTFYLLKQAFRPMLGRRLKIAPATIDTISIGVKK